MKIKKILFTILMTLFFTAACTAQQNRAFFHKLRLARIVNKVEADVVGCDALVWYLWKLRYVGEHSNWRSIYYQLIVLQGFCGKLAVRQFVECGWQP